MLWQALLAKDDEYFVFYQGDESIRRERLREKSNGANIQILGMDDATTSVIVLDKREIEK